MNILKNLWNDKISRISLIILIILYTSILLCDFISPYNPNSRDPKASYMPPSMVYFSVNGKLSNPFIYKTTYIFNEGTFTKKITEDKSEKYYLKAIDLYNEVGSLEGLARAYGVLSTVYLLKKDKTNALGAIEKSEEYYEKMKQSNSKDEVKLEHTYSSFLEFLEHVKADVLKL